MKRNFLKAALATALMVVPAIAEAASGYSTANVNMRSGPSTRYPAVVVIPAGQPVQIHGCLAEVPWCDVSFFGGRGWVAGRYVQATYQQRRVYVDPQYYRPLGIPTVRFSVGNYWDRYYRDRDFYSQRDRWDRGPDWDRDRRPDRGPDWNRDRNRDADWNRRPDRREPDWNRDRNRDNADRGPDQGQPDWNRDRNQNRDGGQDRRRPPQIDENGNPRLGVEACPPARPNCYDNN